LQLALTTRVVLEQAKGMLAERGQLNMEDAFAALRRYSRDHNERLHDVSRGIIEGSVDADLVIRGRRPVV
jgi:AmiR/NasT family two-component response regulator